MLKQPCGSILLQSCELVVLEEDPPASVRFHVSLALPGNHNPVRHQSRSDKLLPGFLPSEAGGLLFYATKFGGILAGENSTTEPPMQAFWGHFVTQRQATTHNTTLNTSSG